MTIWPKKMNIGSGSNYLPGYLNVDINIDHDLRRSFMTPEQQLECPTITHDFMTQDRFPVEYFEYVYARMVMEHIHIDMIPTVLYTLNCCMADEGVLEIIVPDFDEIAHKYIELSTELTIRKLTYLREMTFHLLDPMIDTMEGRGHKSLWTPQLAQFWLEGEGFVVQNIERNYEPFSMRIHAMKDSKFSVATPIRDDYNMEQSL